MTAVCIASGESLHLDDVGYVREHRPDLTIAVNTTFRIAPWADVLYAQDQAWWDVYGREVRETFKGECVTWLRCQPRVRVGNSGHGAINLAMERGHKRILLLGYDFQGGHWHGDHKGDENTFLSNPREYEFLQWLKKIELMARHLGDVEVINCSRQTAIKCFPLSRIQEEL